MMTEHECHCQHDHTPRPNVIAFLIAVLGSAAYTLAQFWGAIVTASLTLWGDAFHSLVDFSGYAVVLGFAIIASRLKQTARRVDPLIGVTSASLLLVGQGYVIKESVERLWLLSLAEVETAEISMLPTWIALGTILVNILVVFLLKDQYHHHHGENPHDHSTAATLLHLITDIFASISVIAANISVALTGQQLWEPVLAFGVAVFFLPATLQAIWSGLRHKTRNLK